MWNGKMKAVTFSYDDGVEQDKRITQILNRYNLKATFNLNGSRHISNGPGYPWVFRNKVTVARMPIEDLVDTYKGHEIAMHAYTHAKLDLVSPEVCKYEVLADKARLTDFFGKVPVGLAYPCGTYNDTVIEVLRENGVKYARGCAETLSFDLPENLLAFDATCEDLNPKMMELAERFVEMKPDKPQLFYIYGHAYAHDYYESWEKLEEFCKFISGRDDIFYGTNAECLLDN
ncbi:MAG: polysaccharide deacetylase family protein [Clostridia bacterium]|nr:polysaccharide deacetylase family protein [Clostridia bacterium]